MLAHRLTVKDWLLNTPKNYLLRDVAGDVIDELIIHEREILTAMIYSFLPYDTSPWKIDDKAWMRARRAQWRDIKPRIKRWTDCYRGDKYLQEYFLTGEIPMDMFAGALKIFHRKSPIFHMTDVPVLVECWLTADTSEENWANIVERHFSTRYHEVWQAYYRSHECLRRIMAKYPLIGTALGDADLEQRLYRFLAPRRCRREDYPHLNDVMFANKVDVIFRNIGSALSATLRADRPNPNRFVALGLEEMLDAMAPAFAVNGAKSGEVAHWLGVHHVSDIGHALRITHSPVGRPLFQVEIAQRFLDLLQSTELTPELRRMTDEALAQPVQERDPEGYCPFDGTDLEPEERNAKICISCLMDWSDPAHPIKRTMEEYEERVGKR